MVIRNVSEPPSTLHASACAASARASAAASRGRANGSSGRVQRLFTPDAGVLGQGIRYIVGGCTTMAVYLLGTTFLALVVGLPFEVALAIGFCAMIVVNFTLHRMFVWMHREGFALSAHRQFARYLAVAGTQYGLTAVGTSMLPGALGVSPEVIYVVIAVSFAVVSFLAYRQGVFHANKAIPTSVPVGIGAPGGIAKAAQPVRAEELQDAPVLRVGAR
jgi:putative flippase GtrA